MLRIAARASAMPARVAPKTSLSSSVQRSAAFRAPTRGFAVEGVPSFHEREKSLEDAYVRRHEKELKQG